MSFHDITIFYTTKGLRKWSTRDFLTCYFRLTSLTLHFCFQDKFTKLPHFTYLTNLEALIITIILFVAIGSRLRTFTKGEVDAQIVNIFTFSSYLLLFVICPMLYIYRTPKMREYVFGKLFRLNHETFEEIQSISREIAYYNVSKNRVGLMVWLLIKKFLDFKWEVQ